MEFGAMPDSLNTTCPKALTMLMVTGAFILLTTFSLKLPAVGFDRAVNSRRPVGLSIVWPDPFLVCTRLTSHADCSQLPKRYAAPGWKNCVTAFVLTARVS